MIEALVELRKAAAEWLGSPPDGPLNRADEALIPVLQRFLDTEPITVLPSEPYPAPGWGVLRGLRCSTCGHELTAPLFHPGQSEITDHKPTVELDEGLRERIESLIAEYGDDDAATWVDQVPRLTRTKAVDDLRQALSNEGKTDEPNIICDVTDADGN